METVYILAGSSILFFIIAVITVESASWLDLNVSHYWLGRCLQNVCMVLALNCTVVAALLLSFAIVLATMMQPGMFFD